MKQAAKKSTLTAKAADKLWGQFQDQPALLTEAQIFEMEQVAQSRIKQDGITRRVALSVLGTPSQQLIKSIQDSRDAAFAFATALEDIKDSARHLSEQLESLQVASLRIAMALCVRDDIETIQAEARLSCTADSASAASG